MTKELERFNKKYMSTPDSFSDPTRSKEEQSFVYDVAMLASHVAGLDHFVQFLGVMTPEDFKKHWSYSEFLIRLTKPIFDYIHPRKLKEGYLPDDQEVLTFVRSGCVKIGAFRQEILRRYNRQEPFTKLVGLNLQQRVNNWLLNCIGKTPTLDKSERDARFLEEAVELMQARGRTKQEIISMVEHVYSRPAGQVEQEMAGTLLTLMAMATAHEHDLMELGETEYRRVLGKMDHVRNKSSVELHFK